MAIKRTKKQIARRKRYMGMQKIKRGSKMCWISQENKHGWSLGFALNSKTVWLTSVRFADRKEIERALKSGVVFVHVKDSDAKV